MCDIADAQYKTLQHFLPPLPPLICINFFLIIAEQK